MESIDKVLVSIKLAAVFQRKVAETTIQALSELLYIVFHCYLILFSLPMPFISIPGFPRWIQRTLLLKFPAMEVALCQAEIVNDDSPN